MAAAIGAFSSGVEMLGALRRGEISARELVELHIARIGRLDARIHSVVLPLFETALREAEAMDDAGAEKFPLGGLPIVVKESVDVVGTPSTAGLMERVAHRPERDARTVAALRRNGAVILGKTNTCPYLADFIAENPVYGRTVSPWDAEVTPGGSSGGAAAVCAGMAAVDWGSDLGGSIRLPAAFCGLWGHKPSEGAVPNSGHFPGSALPNGGALMAAQGPMARSAKDLELVLDVAAMADVGHDVGWRVRFPAARAEKLAEFRVAVLPWQEWVAVDGEIVGAMEGFVEMLRTAGVTVVERSPVGDLRALYRLNRRIMSAMVSVHWGAEHRAQVVADRKRRGEFSFDADVEGFTATAADLLKWHLQREEYRQAYREFFGEVDVLLTPATLVPAFAHPTRAVADRVLEIGGKRVGFDYLTFYPGVASVVGHGATALPIGFTRGGLPIGAQAIGPFLEDRTAIRFAQLVEEKMGGFVGPAGWDGVLG